LRHAAYLIQAGRGNDGESGEVAAQVSYVDLEVEVTSDEGRGYRVEVTSPSGGECAATAPFPLDDRALERRLQGLRLALLSSAANVRRLAKPDEKLVQELGAELFDWLFAGDARVLFDSSRQQAAREGNDQWLRLVLRIRPPELAALPWEFLYDTRRDDYLSLSNPLVRYPEVLEPIRPLEVAPPLRILGLVARPSDRSELDVELEKQWLLQAVTDLTTDGRVEVTWVPGQTWRELRRAINQQQWHVFHFIGHGGFDHETGEGFIALGGDGGGTYRLAASKLGQLLGPHHSLRLVLLNSCESAQVDSRELFSSTATVLMRRGVPAVMAMQYEISDRAAIEFARAFYEAVADGLPVDLAVRDARLAVSLARPNSLEWGTPVLYLRPSSGRIFIPAAAGAQREQGKAPQSKRPDIPKDRPVKLPPPPSSVVAAAGDRIGPPRSGQRGVAGPMPAERISQRSGGNARRLPRPRSATRTRPPLVLALTAVIVALALVGLFGLPALRGAAPGAALAVTVPGNQQWTDSGVDLRQGQRIRITASGEISSAPGVRNDPNGSPELYHAMSLLPTTRHAALIAKVGGRGAAFLIGQETSLQAGSGGRLYLGVNDLAVRDNSGYYRVEVVLSN
jgi:CHAT domain